MPETNTNVFWGVPGALAVNANATLLCVGDSWFWYPLDNLAVEIAAARPNHTVVVVGTNGAESAQWSESYRKDIDYAFRFYGKDVLALLLSGGGNDVAGMKDFLRLLEDDCSDAPTVQQCYRSGQPDAIISKIMGAYREVIHRFRARNRTAPVLMHNYDNAWPTGQGLFGPSKWLKKPMDTARVPEPLRRPLFKDLVAKLHDGQQALSQEPALGPLVAIQTAGTLPEPAQGPQQWWANELHPTPAGFRRLVAQKFLPEIDRLTR